MDINITPSSEANVILSQIATSKLHLDRDVALCGDSSIYWDFLIFHSFCGTIDNPVVRSFKDLLGNRAESLAMSKSSILDRASSITSDDSIEVVRSEYVGYPDVKSESSDGRGADAPTVEDSPSLFS